MRSDTVVLGVELEIGVEDEQKSPERKSLERKRWRKTER
jgi:hypothetical protein